MKRYQTSDRYWWTEEDSEIPSSVFDAVRGLQCSPSTKDDYWLYSAMYGVGTSVAYSSTSFRPSVELQLKDGRLKYNIIRPFIDALMARIATSRTNVTFATHGGKWSDRNKAKLLTKFVQGTFHRAKIYPVLQQVFLDACVFGTGFVKPFMLDDDISVERVAPSDVYVATSGTSTPYAFYQSILADRHQLMGEYPGKAAELSDAAVDVTITPVEIGVDADCVTLIEAWYVGSGDRRHVVVANNVVLVDEPWGSRNPGIAVFRWKDPLTGFLGDSLVAELVDIQTEVNFILRRIQEQMNLGCYKILVDQASSIDTKKLNNQQHAIIKFNSAGKVPIIMQIPPVDKQYFIQLERLEEKARSLVGLSELFTESKKPTGLESGKALREYDDIQSARFLHVGQRWQDFCVAIAERIISLAKNTDGYVAHCDHGDEVLTIDWSEIDLDKSSYTMRAWPTSLLPLTPSGQMQSVLDMLQIDPTLATAAVEHLDYPDVRAMLRPKIAPYAIIQRAIEGILSGKYFIQPDPAMNLEYGIQQMQAAYQQSIIDEEETEVQNAFLDWIALAQPLIAPPQGPGAQLGAPAGPGPMPGMESLPPGMGPPPPAGPAAQQAPMPGL